MEIPIQFTGRPVIDNFTVEFGTPRYGADSANFGWLFGTSLGELAVPQGVTVLRNPIFKDDYGDSKDKLDMVTQVYPGPRVEIPATSAVKHAISVRIGGDVAIMARFDDVHRPRWYYLDYADGVLHFRPLNPPANGVPPSRARWVEALRKMYLEAGDDIKLFLVVVLGRYFELIE